MSKESNIIESVEFLAADDLLVAELDKRLSFSALVLEACSRNNNGHCESLCDCILKKFEPRPCGNLASAVRG
ncbi:MAG TPA: hypothetical protein DEQ38_01895 [Elusimicrobia bacterium]|nr:MAG: hypothetical protein A2089_07570 [Elusimicrobia bacterium GWD2_63_28]HCC46861.1 hypothetical protein [Elusimicrobiota bacterium]